MKKIHCGNKNCRQRRIHFAEQEINRNHQLVEVEDDYEGKAFCSLTCAMLAGYFSATKGWIKNPEDSTESDLTQNNK